VDAYRELGARTAAFDTPSQEVGRRFLDWLQEELAMLPTIVTGPMSFASLATCEGAVNALSREGCGHFEVFSTIRTRTSNAKSSRLKTRCLSSRRGRSSTGCGVRTAGRWSGRGLTGQLIR
jgi:hypothetical protein